MLKITQQSLNLIKHWPLTKLRLFGMWQERNLKNQEKLKCGVYLLAVISL